MKTSLPVAERRSGQEESGAACTGAVDFGGSL
jgi:hypothetical protein